MTDKIYSVSVVIPAYNNSEYIGRAIESVLAQTHPAAEIIVVDDGSTDNTAEVVRQYENKVTYLYQKNAGAGKARNTGISAATSEWIAFLDADDEWLTNRLQRQIELAQRHEHLVWISGNYLRCICGTNRKEAHIDTQKVISLLKGYEYFESFFAAFIKDAWGCTDTMLIKKNIIIEAGMFPKGQALGEDLDLWWRIAYHYPKIGYVSEPIAVYHLRAEGSLIHQRKNMEEFFITIERHLKLSSKYNMGKEFRLCGEYMLRKWLRSMLFEAKREEIRYTLNKFDDILPKTFKTTMRLLTVFPRITAVGCHCISRMVRLLRLRKQIVRKPNSNLQKFMYNY